MSRMNELIEAGLFGRGLIRVTSRTLVDRYNTCLRDMGLKPTKLKTFSVDRLGWSPEVAYEQDNDYYLSHGDANPLAIILTPLQERAPVYFPMHSFDWQLLKEWYSTHRAQINDLTKETAVWLDIDQEVELYTRPSDLLMVGEVVVRAYTPCGIITRAVTQQSLVHRFIREPASHHDTDIIAALQQSAAENGDLRRRQFVVRDTQFTDLVDFYSRAFGGVFVLRSQGSDPIIFVRDGHYASGTGIFPADTQAIPQLIEHGYIENSVSWWKDHTYRLEIVAESFLVDVLEDEAPRLDFTAFNTAKRKGFVSKYADKLDSYIELMRIIDSLKKNVPPENVSEVVYPHLFHPRERLQPSSREVVWQLLTYIRRGRLVPLFYRHQKTAFVESYLKEWRNPRRTWALMRVRKHYDLASKASPFLH